MNAPKVLKRLTALVLLVSLCSALLLLDNTKAQAATATTTVDKIAPELRQLIQSGQGSTRVKVIVQSTSSPSLTSGGLLGGLLGGLVQTAAVSSREYCQLST
jgi:predicted CDP-diglyceride synthetase/phosphatidate cytidylyltransferase